MKRILLAIALCFAAFPAAAQDWKAEWDALVAAARKEGKVVVSISPGATRRDFLQSQWTKDFPGIEISIAITRGTQYVPQVVSERAAGSYLWDVFSSGPNTGAALVRAGILDPLRPELFLPEVKDPAVWGGWESAFYDRERKYVLGLFSDLQSPYYDAKKLSPEKVKRLGLKVLMEPELKDGKITWYDPRMLGPGAPYLALLNHVLGEAALWKIAVDQQPTFVSDLRAGTDALARGKTILNFGGNPEEGMRPYREAGMKFDIRPLGNTPETSYLGTDGATLGVFKNRPHPNAARLFVNWVMTKRISEMLQETQGYDTRRQDVPPRNPEFAAVRGATYVEAQKDENDELIHKLQTEIKKRRPQ
jgi:iron(III) transport system substrate-binding protein